MTATLEAPKKRKFIVRKGRHAEPIPAALLPGSNIDDPFGHKLMKNRNQVFTEGMEVESFEDLIAKHPGKFALAAEPKQVSEERKQAVTDLLRTSNWLPEDRECLENMPDDVFDRTRMRTIFRQSVDGKQSAMGLDVTNQFQIAYDNNYLVFVNGDNKHQITKKGVPGTKPLNKTPLEAGAVEGFIANLLKE